MWGDRRPSDESAPSFGAQLRRHRLAAGLTQEVLAERAGLSSRAIQSLERSERHPYRDTTDRLIAALGLFGAARAAFAAAASPLPRQRPPTGRSGVRLLATGHVTYLSPRHIGRLSDQATGAATVALPHNLPAQVSSFVGRQTELAELWRLLPSTRLLTLTGPGGCGKTRLALEFAGALVDTTRAPPTDERHPLSPERGAAALVASFGIGSGGPTATEPASLLPDGVWLVEFAALGDGALVPQTVAAALGVREVPGRPLLATLVEALRGQRLLLVLDNCEHLREASAAVVDSLLRACRGLRVLATSRQALGLTGEVVRPVTPLPAPPEGTPPEALARYAASRLFLERAAAVAPNLAVTVQTAAAIGRICRQLDGLPIALELAAARVPALGAQQIAARLDQRLLILTGGSPAAAPRHQTLRATIAWSHDLLSAPEAILFRRLAVFARGWTLEAAEAVCADDDADLHRGPQDALPAAALFVGHRDDVLPALLALVGQSLVVADLCPDGSARYRLLDTLHEYALERLEASPDAEVTRRRHAAFYLSLADAAGAVRNGSPEDMVWIDRLEIEQDNLLGALRRAVENGDAERGWRLGAALAALSLWRGYASAARLQLAPLLALPLTACSPDTQLKALESEAELAFHLADYPLAVARHEQRLALCRRGGAQERITAALNDLGHALREQGDYAAARERLQESLVMARRAGDQRRIAVALDLLGTVAQAQGDQATARVRYEESLAIARAIDDQLLLGWTPFNLGCLALDEGNFEAARAGLVESLAVWRGRRALDGVVHALALLASLAAAEGRVVEAIRVAAATTALSEGSGCPIAPFYRGGFERRLAMSRQAVGPEIAAAAWADGWAMSQEQAVAAALARRGTTPGPPDG